jgi:Tfp pilus assembly protein PilO
VVLSKRERYIAIATALVVGILVLDQFILSPLMAQKEIVDVRIAEAQQQLANANQLFAKARSANRNWREMSGTVERSASDAESRVLNNVRQWAQDEGMNLASVKPERTERDKDFDRITFRATGTGGMQQIGRFLYRIETASMPVRVTDLLLSTRKEGTDDLAITVGIATISLAPEPERPTRAGVQ